MGIIRRCVQKCEDVYVFQFPLVVTQASFDISFLNFLHSQPSWPLLFVFTFSPISNQIEKRRADLYYTTPECLAFLLFYLCIHYIYIPPTSQGFLVVSIIFYKINHTKTLEITINPLPDFLLLATCYKLKALQKHTVFTALLNIIRMEDIWIWGQGSYCQRMQQRLRNIVSCFFPPAPPPLTRSPISRDPPQFRITK